MARHGDTLRAGGKRTVFRETADATSGTRLVFDEFVEVTLIPTSGA